MMQEHQKEWLDLEISLSLGGKPAASQDSRLRSKVILR